MAVTQVAVSAMERLQRLGQSLDRQADFVDAVATLRSGGRATFDGVWGSSCALLASTLASHAPGPVVVVCPQLDDIDDFCADFALFSGRRPDRFPAWEAAPGEQRIHDEIYADRVRCLKSLSGGGLSSVPTAEATDNSPLRTLSPVVVTSIQSLLQPVPPRAALAGSTRWLRVGDRVEVDSLLRWLVESGFHNTSAVELPGEFSMRGGILDVFAADWVRPVRVEWFGDELESIREFEVASQRSLERRTAVEITVLRLGEKHSSHLAEYLPRNSWFVLVELQQIAEHARQYVSQREGSAELQGTAELHSLAAVLQHIEPFAQACVSGLAQDAIGAVCHLQIESVERFSGEIGKVRDELDRIGVGHDVFVLAPTDAEVERLGELLGSTHLAARGSLHFPLGTLRQGFRLTREQAVVITAHELFHRGELRRIPRRRLGKAIDSFLELHAGDLVVHLAHGIGRYRGLRLLDKQGQVEEHLEIEFDGGTKIFVPAVKIGLVQKYVGGTKTRPTLAKIGGKNWVRQKKAAESAVLDLAAEMLELQALRATRAGIAFGFDSDWQREFDASFPYQETPDQLTAIEAIKVDMRRPRPMDRLLCGDVGFGKTELAMRAAFKAVDHGYQVAVLVPTTILAEQHFHTFRERMAEFPLEIAKLSRFCTPAEERQAIEGLLVGRVDIVIGTHRLASKDVEFSNLGLVIIDEEQRFGVEVKERLKTLRSTVDVLTLSATPIPRTLHMSLVGVRDISNLETPPEDRTAVETRVTRWDDELIRHAVLRELSRNGQIYFVHNRVNDIEIVAQKLQRIVPEARIRIGHGQMPETELERVMVDFVAHRFDLLLATTIIESGLDIANANTIFIDEADRYGLADLHQLRGRVGRYKHRAYGYLLVDPHKSLTPNAARRLRAIEEFSDMGAGFAIAMRDLEIRGAGNLLGTQQSGHIAAVGYELYCQLLEDAVRSLKKLPRQASIDVDIDLPGQAYLPDEYIPDVRLKIDLYRRLNRVASVDQLQELRHELVDRFGKIPEPAESLLALLELKIDAAVWQIAAINLEDRYVVFHYTQAPRIQQLAKKNAGRLRIVDERCVYLPIPPPVKSPDQILELIKSVLQPK